VSQPTVPLERKLLRYVLVEPKLVGEIESDLLEEGLSETSFLNFIAGRQIDGDASAAFLLDYFHGTDFEEIVFQAQTDIEEHRLPAETIAMEFKSVHVALRIKRMNEEIELLKAKVNADPRLSPELSQRIKDLAQLKSQRVAPSV